MRIATVSEHASPLAALGGVDAGGQNVYVARLAPTCCPPRTPPARPACACGPSPARRPTR
jgi:hypothetical protein